MTHSLLGMSEVEQVSAISSLSLKLRAWILEPDGAGDTFRLCYGPKKKKKI